jgi:hypothetical protein
MFIVYKDNVTPVHIRPTPLISISHVPNKNKMGTLGCKYSITLNGTIISHDGSPYVDSQFNSLLSSSYNNPSGVNPDIGDRLTSIMFKQNSLRDLFSKDGQKCEIKPISQLISGVSTFSGITFYPNVVSINFEDGPYIETSKYSINLEAPLLFDPSGNIYPEGLIGSTFSPKKFNLQRSTADYYQQDKTNIKTMLDVWGGLVEDFTDTWSLDTDESNAQYSASDILPVSYRVTRNISAIGQPIPSGIIGGSGIPAWQSALGFIKKTILQETSSPSGYIPYSGVEHYPGFRTSDTRIGSTYSSGILNLPDFYRGYNHARSFNINKAEGSCSVTDTWILASGQSHLENYTLSIDNSLDNPFTNVKIDGTIKGLCDIHASGYQSYLLNPSGQGATANTNTPFIKAQKHYFDITNSGLFGIGSAVFKRANNLASPLILNSQPLSITLGLNELQGEITYNLEFNDRPYTYFSGVLAENITVNDTYPGDVFATIPVIGRKTGPILQYITGRTEYNRNLNIEVILDYTDIPYSGGRNLLYKPSLNAKFASDMLYLIRQLSPSGELNVSKYFLQPPTETWTPKEGRYTLNLNWVYEKSI